jgi:hypothetical protein
LGDVVNDPNMLVNPRNLPGYIYGDARTHETPPTARANGRADWYQVDAIGTGDPSTGVYACLGVTSLPTDAWFELCMADAGLQTFTSAGCQAVQGGAPSVCVKPPARTDTGSYYVRVRKLAGTNSLNAYALFLKH